MGYKLAGCRLLQQIKRSREKELFDMENKQEKGGLNKSLKLIFVYTVATGSGIPYSMDIAEAERFWHSH